MKYIGTFIKMLSSGRGFKAYIWGQPELHIADWNGCNYRRATIDGQPLFGFKTIDETKEFVLNKFKTERDISVWASKFVGDGTFLTDEFITETLDIKWSKEKT